MTNEMKAEILKLIPRELLSEWRSKLISETPKNKKYKPHSVFVFQKAEISAAYRQVLFVYSFSTIWKNGKRFRMLTKCFKRGEVVCKQFDFDSEEALKKELNSLVNNTDLNSFNLLRTYITLSELNDILNTK